MPLSKGRPADEAVICGVCLKTNPTLDTQPDGVLCLNCGISLLRSDGYWHTVLPDEKGAPVDTPLVNLPALRKLAAGVKAADPWLHALRICIHVRARAIEMGGGKHGSTGSWIEAIKESFVQHADTKADVDRP